MTFEVNSLEDLNKVAENICQLYPDNNIFIFDAPMGAGKTTLISKICEKWQIEEKCSSPTYAIYNEYYSPKVGSIFHFDCYRLKTFEEALDSGFDEIINDKNLCLIEWPQIIKKLLPEKYVEVRIELNNEKRTITIHL